MVGRDPLTAVSRYDFGVAELRGGIDTAAAVIGLLAVSELFLLDAAAVRLDALSAKFEARFPPLGALWRVAPAVGIGTLIGSVIGAIPGVSGTASAVISYQQSKFWSLHPEEYGGHRPKASPPTSWPRTPARRARWCRPSASASPAAAPW